MKVFLTTLLLLMVLNVTAKRVEVVFKSADGTQLSGTVFIPNGKGRFPAVVFVHGSGKETRKNSVFSAKWFASIGYVALVYDKRGTGKSSGDTTFPDRFDFNTLAEDARAAVDHLLGFSEVDTSRIGLHAVSQGGWVAPIVATRASKVSFMIVKSASVTTVEEDRIFERTARLRSEGFTEQDLEEAKQMQLVEPKYPDQVNDDFIELFEAYKSRSWFHRVYPDVPPTDESLTAYRTWYASNVQFDPVEYLENLTVPVFWIFGDAKYDTHAPVAQSLENLRLLESRGKKYVVKVYAGEGHTISERKYELALFKWLQVTNSYDEYVFKRH